MPLRNRVTPFGDIIATEARGLLFGNRGVLHDENGRLVRKWQVRRWIACRLEFKGRRRPLLRPGRFTELFFLDEATALAAGHRPCAECRREDFVRFRDAWLDTHPGASTRVDGPPVQTYEAAQVTSRTRSRPLSCGTARARATSTSGSSSVLEIIPSWAPWSRK